MDHKRLRRILARRRRKLGPPLEGDPNGTWLPDPLTGRQVFVPFDDLQYACKDVMNPENDWFFEQECGKMHWSKDPTYNLRRKK